MRHQDAVGAGVVRVSVQEAVQQGRGFLGTLAGDEKAGEGFETLHGVAEVHDQIAERFFPRLELGEAFISSEIGSRIGGGPLLHFRDPGLEEGERRNPDHTTDGGGRQEQDGEDGGEQRAHGEPPCRTGDQSPVTS